MSSQNSNKFNWKYYFLPETIPYFNFVCIIVFMIALLITEVCTNEKVLYVLKMFL